MAAFQRCEVWTAFACNSGARVAIIGRPDIIALTSTERVTREDSLTLAVSADSAAVSALALGYVLRVQFDDGTFTEWRIHQLDDKSGKQRGEFRVRCRAVLYELRDAAVITTTTGTSVAFGKQFDGVDAATVITYLLTLLPSYWAAGTIDPSVVVSFAVTDASPLEALRTLATACAAAGAPCELDVRRNGTTGYYLDLVTEIGSSVAGADIRTRKNILASERSRSRETLVNRIYPTIGGTLALPYAYWRATSVSGSDIELRQAETSAPAIVFDDQLIGAYLENDAGTKTQITDSVASTSKVTVASAAGYSANEWCRVVADSSGTDFVKLDVPNASPVKVGLYETGGDLLMNIVDNPYLSRWPGSTSAPPTGWSSITGGTYTQNTNSTYIRRGKYSCRMQTGTAGHGLRTDTVNLVPGKGTTYCAKIAWYQVTGQHRVQLKNQAGADLGNVVTGSAGWNEYEFTGIATGAATGIYLQIVNWAGAGSEIYVDSAQITWGATQLAWTQGCNPSIAWTRANMQLVDTATDPTTYTFTVADLNSWSADEWPYDALVMGSTLSITDTDLGITTTARIQELQRDYLNPLGTTVVLERQLRTLTTRLAAAA